MPRSATRGRRFAQPSTWAIQRSLLWRSRKSRTSKRERPTSPRACSSVASRSKTAWGSGSSTTRARAWRLARRLIGTAELDRARAILEELESEAATWGSEELRGVLLRSLGRVDWLAGRWDAALERTALALEFWEQMQAPHGVALTAPLRALLEVDLGRVDEARASAERGVAISRELSDQEWEILSLGALGRLELALGNLTAAGKYMDELPARLFALGYHDPTAPVWADAVEVLLGLGELEQSTWLPRSPRALRATGG